MAKKSEKEGRKKTLVDWPEAVKMLKELGAHEVLRVEAKNGLAREHFQ